MRGQWEAMLAGAARDATKYRPEYSRHQIRKSSSSISMKADQILSWNIKAEQNVFLVSCLKCKQSPRVSVYLFICLYFTRPNWGFRYLLDYFVFVSYWLAWVCQSCPLVQELWSWPPRPLGAGSDTNDILSSGLTRNLKITRQLNWENTTKFAASSPRWIGRIFWVVG